jgi:hypothetical protein
VLANRLGKQCVRKFSIARHDSTTLGDHVESGAGVAELAGNSFVETSRHLGPEFGRVGTKSIAGVLVGGRAISLDARIAESTEKVEDDSS